jgi:uncharacterized protein (TIGR00369 family)
MAKRKPAFKTRNIGLAGAREVVLSPAARALGMKLKTVTKKRIVAELKVRPHHYNRTGRVNGGALMSFADALGAAGTVANLPPGHGTTTLESKTNFFAAGEGPVLTGIAIPLHIGRSTNVWQTTITNPDGRKVAIVTQTQIVIPVRTPAAAPPAKSPKRR